MAEEIKQIKESENFIFHFTTLNCGGDIPDSYLELLSVFSPPDKELRPDIYVIGLQEIVKLDAYQVIQGKNKGQVKSWEKILCQVMATINESAEKKEDIY